MRWECRERFPRQQPQRKPLVNYPGMHHGIYYDAYYDANQATDTLNVIIKKAISKVFLKQQERPSKKQPGRKRIEFFGRMSICKASV